ncbi:NAD-dependent deacylase [uncultured Marinococcus sp.]|uniref:NAD-dependent deacylase n=1 Tax=uncultured Marinococcus sp. TaxID=487012 RepID=UPI00260F0801|nr:NAD-dependent deacylase [uncultured Marinococcus sp.]
MSRQLAEWLQGSNYSVVMTGAGMSTDSGLPDFRSSSGLWSNHDPKQLATVEALEHQNEAFTKFYQWRLQSLLGASPNKGHEILAQWEQQDLLQHVITQNVDGFHQAAGQQHVSALHGSLREINCHICGRQASQKDFLNGSSHCPHCGGKLRPGIVLFGEMLPEQAIQQAQEATAACDLFIVLGSSLQVAPASLFPIEAKESGARLVIVNQEETELDSWADLTFPGASIQNVLTEANKHL